jgi:3-hydroxy-9,10-secoandrosta-1,3,5(10)-triene-9,17-dione monooxygenase
MIGRARALIPALRQRALKGERERRVADATIAEMQAAGLFRVLQPKRWGGYELDVPTCFEIQMALGEGDMSVAWIYGIVGLHPWLLALYDDRAAQDVWRDDSTTLICSSLQPAGTATPAEGGFVLNGHWRYCSGSDHCRWAFIGASVATPPDAPEDRRIFLVPRAQWQPIDTWHVAGLKATGSNDIVLKDVFVPDYRSQKFSDNFRGVGPGQAVNTALLYKLPFGQIFFRGISTASLGALQGMLNAFLDYARTRTSRSLAAKASDDALVHLLCAEATIAIDEMKAMIHRDFRVLEDYASRGELPPMELRVRIKFYSSSVAERCLQLAGRLFKAAGAGGSYADQPFGRMLADMTMARQHLSNQFEHLGRTYGASLFGIDNNKDMVL